MKELICITCPRGCRLTIDDNMNITGNNCPNGIIYAKTELTHPTRMVTSTVLINSQFGGRLPVKTSKPIPKELIFRFMDVIKQISVNTPIKIGDVVCENVLGTGIDIVATKDVVR